MVQKLFWEGYMVQQYCWGVPSNVQGVPWLKSGVSWFMVPWLKSGVTWFKNIVSESHEMFRVLHGWNLVFHGSKILSGIKCSLFRVFHGWNLQPHPHLHHSAPHRWKYVIMYFNTRETTQSRTNVIFHSCTWPPVLSTCKRWKPLTWLLVLWLRLRWCRCWCWWCCRC